MTADKKQKTFEGAIERLEEITGQLESGDLSLEDSIDLYTEGLKIAKLCSDKLGEAEKKIKVIVEKSGIMTETDFDSEETDQ